MVPIECVFSEDSIDYVFVKGGLSDEKRVVKTGSSNLNFIVIEDGLKEDEEVLFHSPESNKEES